MNDLYSEVREHLRQEHARNTNEIYVRNRVSNGYYTGVQENMRDVSWTFSLKGKVIVFIVCVMLFSCYLYGGKDVKKGAVMAWSDMRQQITVLEDEQPYVKEAITKVKQIYEAVSSYIKEYTGEME